ncbi:MAG: hypothetical protein CL608_04485 [Anaerolineaceae bacterium]|nr:hypothetical protein [Anaerolineaceae bacterium]
MMPLPKYSGNTESKPAALCPSGKSLIRPLKPMPKNKIIQSGSDPARKAFTTIDDAVETVPVLEKLTDILKELGQRKYPLAIRKGVIVDMAKQLKSAQIKGSGSTYFLDVEKAKTGSIYLKITQSRKSDGDEFERSSIYIFPEDVSKFGKTVAEMIKEVK